MTGSHEYEISEGMNQIKTSLLFTQIRPAQDQSHQHSIMGRHGLTELSASLGRYGQLVNGCWGRGVTFLGGRTTSRLPVLHSTCPPPFQVNASSSHQSWWVTKRDAKVDVDYLEKKRPFSWRGREQNRVISSKAGQIKLYICIKL